jgi:methylated-DNA-protein-cysteine methyltransferase-like protein
MEPYTQRVIEIIKGIPAGRVMTYGQIAGEAGHPRGARQVVRVLHAMSRAHGLPWHRVVNAKGEIAIMDDELRFTQTALLESEGVPVDDRGRIELASYRYTPDCDG